MDTVKFLDYVFFELAKKNRKSNLEILSIIEELRNNNIITNEVFQVARKKILDNMNFNSRELQESFEKVRDLIYNK